MLKVQDAITDLIGSPDEVRADLSEFKRSAQAFTAEHPRMIVEYPKQWVAVYQGTVAATSNDFDALMSEIDDRGLPRESVAVRFIEKNHRTLIL
jgi:hypothetical protein